MFSDVCADTASELIQKYLHYKIGNPTHDDIYPKKEVLKVLHSLYYLSARSDLQKFDGTFPDEKTLRRHAKVSCKKVISDWSL